MEELTLIHEVRENKLYDQAASISTSMNGPSNPNTMIQAMVIEQVPVHKRDISRAPLGLLRDNDSLKVTMAVPALYE